MKSRTPFPLNLIRGQIGKKIVVKHYAYGVVTTRYSDMSRVVPSPKQLENRRRFRAACAHAQTVLSDPDHRKYWESKARRNKITARNLLIRLYLREHPVGVASTVQPVSPPVRRASEKPELRLKQKAVETPIGAPVWERGVLRVDGVGRGYRMEQEVGGVEVLLFSG